MDLTELAKTLELEEHLYRTELEEVPIVDPGVYNTLGKKLFDFYQKYEVSQDDQRKMEAIAFTMTAFNLRKSRSKRWWESLGLSKLMTKGVE